MTRWHPAAKLAKPTDMMKVTLSGKQHLPRFSRGYGSYRMRLFVKKAPAVLQLTKAWPHGQDVLERRPDVQYCAGSHPSRQYKGDMAVPLKCQLRRGACIDQYCLLQEGGSYKKIEGSSEVVRARKPSVPAKNAWAKKFVPTMEDFPQTLAAAAAVAPPQLQHTVEVSKPQVPLFKTVTNKGIIAGSASKRLPASVQTD